MTLSGHVSISLISLKLIPNPLLIIVLNILVHLPLDAIPHAEWTTFQKSKTKEIIITVFDAAVSVYLIFLGITTLSWPLYFISIAILAGLWIDLLDFALKGRYKKLRLLHELLHTWPQSPRSPVDWDKTITGRTPMWLKLLIQSSIVVSAVFILNR